MKQNVKIIMLGDSLTAKANWKELLEQENILNLGVNGDTTKDILQRLNTIIEIKPESVFIMAGVNDMSYSIAIEEILEHYKEILQTLNEHDIKTVVMKTLCTTMPALNKKITPFNELLQNYCHDKNIETIDLNPSFCDEQGLLKQELTTDGLHLGQKAYKAWGYKLRQHRYFNT